MTLTKSTMRLFNGHQKMDQESLKKVFLLQLNNIFCIKSYLVINLPAMAESASFNDLKNAILESVDEIKLQLLRMDEIYRIIGESYSPRQCVGVRALTMEAYVASKAPGMSYLETDLTLLYHMYTLESIEIASFTALHDLALSLPQNDLSILLKQNLDTAKDNKELYELISREYIN
jgi:ferritin-like metal-binding protein YciE